MARTFLPVRVPDPDIAGLSPRYCYSVWLRHLASAWQHGLDKIPEVVIELGPGASQGIGLAALLSGADFYHSIDVVDNLVQTHNLDILEPMIELFRNRVDIPDSSEFPALSPPLPSYRFPAEILPDRILDAALKPERLDAIRSACRHPNPDRSRLGLRHHMIGRGRAPLPIRFADMILSQSVMIYLPDLDTQYQAMSCWLKPGGYMSHQNDYNVDLSFSDMEFWNSHWGCSDTMWSLLKWRQLYVINRHPHSTHVELMKKYGFEIVAELRSVHPGMPRERLAQRFRDISDEDLCTRGAFILAKKRQ